MVVYGQTIRIYPYICTGLWSGHLLFALEAGRRVDQAAYDRLGEKAHRELEEQEAERKRMEERGRLEREISSRLKNKNLPVHVHGNMVDIGEKTYSLEDVRSKLNLR